MAVLTHQVIMRLASRADDDSSAELGDQEIEGAPKRLSGPEDLVYAPEAMIHVIDPPEELNAVIDAPRTRNQ